MSEAKSGSLPSADAFPAYRYGSKLRLKTAQARIEKFVEQQA
jgi:hypothetical protein